MLIDKPVRELLAAFASPESDPRWAESASGDGVPRLEPRC